MDRLVAGRLTALRGQRGWTLEELAGRSGMSRATLSRIERCELSPTAAMLGKLCSAYGWTLSRLFADAETGSPSLVRASGQVVWTDPESGYQRKAISPPGSGFRGEMVEVKIPPGATVTFEASPLPRLEHHLWMISGALDLELDGIRHSLQAGDCLRYLLNGPSIFEATGKRAAHYVVVIVHP